MPYLPVAYNQHQGMTRHNADDSENLALIIVSATQAERPPSSARCNLYGTGL